MTKDINEIFKSIFANANINRRRLTESTENVETIQLVNRPHNERRETENFEAFEKLIGLMMNSKSKSSHRVFCESSNHDSVEILPHTWSVKDNYFYVFVHPFIHKKYYEMVYKSTNFNQFFITTSGGDFGNKTMAAGEYYYWPNVSISYYGWRHHLLMKFDIDIGDTIPLIHHKDLGNVNLFVFNPEDFINIELRMYNKKTDQVLFVNGRGTFSDDDDVLFEMTMSDFSEAVCQVKQNLVFSNKNFFNYLRDDINLLTCTTSKKYAHLIDIDLENLRLFKKTSYIVKETVVVEDRLKVFKNITASSEISTWFQTELLNNLNIIKDGMIEVLSKSDAADNDVISNYMWNSDFVNFDYLIFVLWQKLCNHSEAETFSKTDIKLFFELLVEIVFSKSPERIKKAQERCEPYAKLTPKVFTRLCNHWAVFLCEDPCLTLAHYFAIHVMIFEKHNNWNYTIDNVKSCDVSTDLMMSGYMKKLVSNNTTFIFNGKHYAPVKEKDDLYKLLDKKHGINLPSIKFNNWKYLYFTEEGVYNLIINDYHSSCPFLLGNTLIKSLTKKNEKVYVPERVIQYMLDQGKYENDVYRVYHMAKISRDMKILKKNITVVAALNNCAVCKEREQLKLNDVFREIWCATDDELVAIGIYTNCQKINDLINNYKCDSCKYYQAAQNQYQYNCSCLDSMEINYRAFKIALITQFFAKSDELVELIWSLLYSDAVYCKGLETMMDDQDLIVKYASFMYESRVKIIDYLYKYIDRLDFVDSLIYTMAYPEEFLENLKSNIDNVPDYDQPQEFFNNNNNDDDEPAESQYNSDEFVVDVNDRPSDNKSKKKKSSSKRKSKIAHEEKKTEEVATVPANEYEPDNQQYRTIKSFYKHFTFTNSLLKKWPVWWDKLIVKRPTDDLTSWLIRFYMRIFMTKLDLSMFSNMFIRQLVRGYLYFRGFTNFNYTNSLLMIHFGASMGIPSDYEKCCIYLNGKPGSGKSSFFELLEYIVVVHKHDSEKYTLSKKDTNEMEADKMISQLYVINEMKVCDDSFFKSTADSTKSNSVCRKFQGSQKYEANYKLLIVNNKPLHISNYDKGVRNRFAVVYTDHLFEENLPFNGSIYWHIKNKLFPMEKSYNEGLAKPVRIFLSHILMYKRNAKDGYVPYKNIIKNDPIHNHNLMCLDVNNSSLNALLYVLRVHIRPGARIITEEKLKSIVEMALPQVESMLHDLLKTRHNTGLILRDNLCIAFRRKFKKYYKEENRCFFSIDMAQKLEDFNTNRPDFLC
ncbi:DNA-helicase [Rachiplusia nu nucleopolyhedrovirus]|uniref:DNA-helicase n=1 Tax=Rachiplusia nu nucleopolyhedrovirus TaxID=2605775 RepID=A0AAE6IRE1_9ABAC|nr:DNA-helicase [Rachiplusia nu nucleopolyhedrovirus]QEI03679.1 DNA-helicase [Rachiplusia nu nucleopolyhedrovirus]